MKIEIHNTSVDTNIAIDDDADAFDCVDIIAGAMLMEGWDVRSIRKAFIRFIKRMEDLGDEV